VPESFAIEVKDPRIVAHPNRIIEIRREYPLAANGRTDERFYFAANKIHPAHESPFWSLRVVLSNADRWAPGVSAAENVETIYTCIDRFSRDIPDANVRTVWIEITDDSPIWSEIKRKLVDICGRQEGRATVVPAEATEAVVHSFRTSPYMREIATSIAKRLNRKFTSIQLGSEGLLLEEQIRGKSWKTVVQTPHVGISMQSLSVTFGFEPLGNPIR
jgi:hypothetical protein